MATSKGNRKPRQPKVYADEEAIKAKMDPIQKKKKEGKDLTDKESETLAALRVELGTLKFKRLAKQRFVKAVIAVRNIGKLGGPGYTRTPEQIKTLTDGLQDEVKKAVGNLQPKVGGGEKPSVEIAL